MKFEDMIIELSKRNSCLNFSNVDIDKYYKQIIKIDNPFIYDRIIKLIEFKKDVSMYNEERNIIIKKRLLNQKNNALLDCLLGVTKDNYREYNFTEDELDYIKRNISNDLDECLKIISNHWVLNYIIYYFFQDTYYNFICNLFQMCGYLKKIKRDLVDIKHLELYNKFNNLSSLSFADKIEFFKNNCDKNDIMGMFYDDMRKVKNHSYQSLVNNSLKLNNNLNIYNKELSQKYGLDVYYLNGEPFYAFVRVFGIKRDDLFDNSNYINSSLNRLGYSFSFISDKNIGTIDYMQKNVVLFYDNIDYNDIMYVNHSDLFSGNINNNQDRFISTKINEIFTPNDLIANTDNYNEVYIREHNLKPSALICYDNVTKNDLKFAKKYNLSILIINRLKYKRYENFNIDLYGNSYII